MTTERDEPTKRAPSRWRSLLAGACAAAVCGALCWVLVPWSPTGCRQRVASLRTVEGARYELTQTFGGILELYYARLFYRGSDNEDWLGYWLGKEDLFWRASLDVDAQTGHVRVVRSGEIIGDFDPERRMLWHRVHKKPIEAIEVVHELETCDDR
jgi:hypothetical protein